MVLMMMTVLMHILPMPKVFFACSVCLMCLPHQKVSGAICAKLNHLLVWTKHASLSLMEVVAAILVATSCVQN
jgi:hypothetical protein